jgi:GntR family transcriptional regulator, transcriptional repressor for pyruvate dehydrogenase complex
MSDIRTQPSQSQIDELLNAAFRLNGALLSARDKLGKDIGLSSALWQVMSEVARGTNLLSAAQIARRVGLTRQAVQRTVNELAAAGMVAFADDPDDRRSQLISMTAKGKEALALANDRQLEWMAAFGGELDRDTLAKAADFMCTATAIAGEVPELQASEGRLAPEPIQVAEPSRASPPPRQVKKARAFEGVNDYILAQIKDGALASGGKLPAERELASALSVGRPAVREALRSLEMSGVLRFERGASGGAFVRETGSDGMALSIRNMLILGRLPPFDLNEVRTCILGQSARLGAERGTEADYSAIERNIDLIQERGKTDDPMATIAPVIEFYQLVGISSHNPLMVILVNAIAEVMHEMLVDLQLRTTIDVIAPRREMLAAMRRGRPDEAERAIRLHFEETGTLLLDYKPATTGGWVRTRAR